MRAIGRLRYVCTLKAAVTSGALLLCTDASCEYMTSVPIQAFYMRLNSDDKTVAAMDLLVPRVGELIGGSQREERLQVSKKRQKNRRKENKRKDKK